MNLTSEQLETQKMLVEKFQDRIYAKHERINLNIVKQIAKVAGLEGAEVFLHPSFGYLMINYEIVDPYGEPKGEIETLYEVCLWLKGMENS